MFIQPRLRVRFGKDIKAMTIAEIAARAGVSAATISRVLNHPEVVQPETRERVLSIMEECNYSPNWSARALRMGKPGMIVLLVPGVENTFYQMIASGVETVTSAKSYTVALCATHGDAKREGDYLMRMADRQVDGFILVNSLLSTVQLKVLSERGIPTVHIGKRMDGACRCLCYIDHEEGGCKLMQHLLQLGHRRIALLLDPLARILEEQVRSGVSLSMLQASAETKPLFYSVENSVSGGFNAVKRMLAEDKLPDAVIAGSTEQVMGVVHAAQSLGLSIPTELAVACLSDAPVCSILVPPVTGIAQPVKRLGMMAARMLFDVMDSAELAEELPQEITLKPKLQIRRSCGNTKYIYESLY